MKIKNIFKKEVKLSNIQKMDKKQLEKVIGGVDVIKEYSSAEEQLKSNPRH